MMDDAHVGQPTLADFPAPLPKPLSRAAQLRIEREERHRRNAALDRARTAWCTLAVDEQALTRAEMIAALQEGIDVPGYGKIGTTEWNKNQVNQYVEGAIDAWRKRTGATAYRVRRGDKSPIAIAKKRASLLADAKKAAAA